MSKKANIIYCNCCGRQICTEEKKDQTSFLMIKKEWGYFSNGKDGTRHRIDICEACYDRLVKNFTIPPEVEQITEFL